MKIQWFIYSLYSDYYYYIMCDCCSTLYCTSMHMVTKLQFGLLQRGQDIFYEEEMVQFRIQLLLYAEVLNGEGQDAFVYCIDDEESIREQLMNTLVANLLKVVKMFNFLLIFYLFYLFCYLLFIVNDIKYKLISKSKSKQYNPFIHLKSTLFNQQLTPYILLQQVAIQKMSNTIQQHQKQQSKQTFIKELCSTNNVIIYQDKKQNTVFLPGYLRVKFKNFNQMELQNLVSEINATIIFNIYYGDLFKYTKDFQEKFPQDDDLSYEQEIIRMMTEQIILNFSRDDALLLSQRTGDDKNLETSVKHMEKTNEVKFTVRKTFHIHLDCQLFLSPFQIINSIFQITVQPFEIKINDKKWLFKINLMDHPEIDPKLSHSEQRNFGHYGLAINRLRAIYSNQRVQKADQFYMTSQQRKQFKKKKKASSQGKKKQQVKKDDKKDVQTQPLKKKQTKGVKVDYFQYAIFNIPMFKYPLASLATIFIPLFLLAIINLGIFFQDYTLSDRIASIAGLMIAFVAFIPTIRQQIPPSSNIILVQILVYAQTLTSLLALIHSLKVMDNPDFQLVWTESVQYLISCVITGSSFFAVVAMMMCHYIIWKRNYLQKPDSEYKKSYTALNPNNENVQGQKKGPFIRDDWFNESCDRYYSNLFDFYCHPFTNKPGKKAKSEKSIEKIHNEYFVVKPKQK